MISLFQTLKNARLPELLPARPHICDSKFCDPQTELTLVRRGLLNPTQNPDTSVYICKFGQFHVCDPNECMIDGPCLVSGASMAFDQTFDDYNPVNPKSWSAPTVRILDTRSQAKSKAEFIVDSLLYSPERQKICTQWSSVRNKRIQKEKNSYVQSCVNTNCVPIDLIHLQMIATNTSSLPPLEILQKNQGLVDYYVGLVMNMYENVQKHLEEKVCIEAITLGLLYKMQQGKIIDGIVLIPVDDFLVRHLPLMNDLPKFGIDKKKFTKGEKLINQLFNKRGINLKDVSCRI